LAALLADHPDVRHIKIHDARRKPLGRSFRVKLWPSLIFLRDGVAHFQIARPSPKEIEHGLSLITPPSP